MYLQVQKSPLEISSFPRKVCSCPLGVSDKAGFALVFWGQGLGVCISRKLAGDICATSLWTILCVARNWRKLTEPFLFWGLQRLGGESGFSHSCLEGRSYLCPWGLHSVVDWARARTLQHALGFLLGSLPLLLLSAQLPPSQVLPALLQLLLQPSRRLSLLGFSLRFCMY